MQCPPAVVIGGRRIELTNCLPKSREDWSPELASLLAEVNGLRLDEEALRVLKFVRSFWLENETCPPVSIIEEELGIDRGRLMQMFRNYDVMCILAGAEPPSGCLSKVFSQV
ncbi:MAG: TusE/DsrC/DsvC family sulfur relay protein [Pyrobaculum sp.]